MNMSTFKGIVAEFPDIRIDFFRPHHHLKPPLACFLSHVHSDHLAGLDSLKAPFVYCSPATREILLRLEKYPHRMNFESGILESRKQTYKHLEKLLKPIPLETPTKIELEPGNVITVTLFDANHCPGAVMFLLENDTKAILYTGDIRSERSFVANIRRNPHLIEYTTAMRTLDCLYLDTSNTGESRDFPSKEDGLAELLEKVAQYPKDTVFYFSAWTYGYEEVWMALSKMLKSRVHVDRYKMRIYKSLVRDTSDGTSAGGAIISHEGPALAGFQCGNTKQKGCLTENPDVRIHSCEKGTHCPSINGHGKVVWITPIVTRMPDGTEIAEIGVGGGGGDLNQHPELELVSEEDVDEFLKLVEHGMNGEAEKRIRQQLLAALHTASMTISLEDLGLRGLDRDQNELSLGNFAEMVAKSAAKKDQDKLIGEGSMVKPLPTRITFPYSRHASFSELRDLVGILKPKDIYPCTVDEECWHEGISINAQFGDLCTGTKFRHDFQMRQQQAHKYAHDDDQQTHTTESSDISSTEGRSPDKSVHFAKLLENRLDHLEATKELIPLHATSKIGSMDVFPPKDINGRSPGSQSQNLRRKAILEDLGEDGTTKRLRLSQIGDSQSTSSLTESTRKENLGDDFGGSFPMSSGVDTPVSDSFHDTDPGSESYELLEDMEHKNFYDEKDGVHRCGLCGYELQSRAFGLCSHCAERQMKDPYFEEFEDSERSGCPKIAPKIAYNEYTDKFMTKEDRVRYIGDFLDDDEKAYDSQDLDSDFESDYDSEDSFIDDTLDEEENDENDDEMCHNIGDEESHWEQQYKQLEEQHKNIVIKHEALQKAHGTIIGAYQETTTRYHELLDELGIEISGDEEADEEDVEEDMDENGLIIVNPRVPDVILAEVVLAAEEEASKPRA